MISAPRRLKLLRRNPRHRWHDSSSPAATLLVQHASAVEYTRKDASHIGQVASRVTFAPVSLRTVNPSHSDRRFSIRKVEVDVAAHRLRTGVLRAAGFIVTHCTDCAATVSALNTLKPVPLSRNICVARHRNRRRRPTRLPAYALGVPGCTC